MTRINLVPPSELSDQHLLAEYKELPRCIKQSINITNAPVNYVLGKGHMKWARRNWKYLLNRYFELCKELSYRNFNINYSSSELNEYFYKNYNLPEIEYVPSELEISISRNRIIEKVNLKPNWYRWTNRSIPKYLSRV